MSNLEISSNDDVEAKIVPKKPKKQRRTELENLEIDLKGWNLIYRNSSFEPFVSGAFLNDKLNNSAPCLDEEVDNEFNSDLKDYSYDFDEHLYLV